LADFMIERLVSGTIFEWLPTGSLPISCAWLQVNGPLDVFGTSRSPRNAEAMAAVEMLPLEVRADDSARACVEAVVNRGGRLDVLINNAGLRRERARSDETSIPRRLDEGLPPGNDRQ